jgi:hypothetical protein
VQYDLSQIGNTPEAVAWIKKYDTDSTLKKLVYFSTGKVAS